MIQLALETSSDYCSAALSVNGVIHAQHEHMPQQHSAKLLAMIHGLLSDASIETQQLDVIVFGRGPGSFTGLRIAAACAQGLALATQAKILGISTLHSLAHAALTGPLSHHETIIVANDARAGELYFAEFKLAASGDVILIGEEALITADDLALRLNSTAKALVGNAFQSYQILNPMQSGETDDLVVPSAQAHLKLASTLLSEASQDPLVAQPVYVRHKVADTLKERGLSS